MEDICAYVYIQTAVVSLAAVVNVWDKLKQSVSNIVFRASERECTRPGSELAASSAAPLTAGLLGNSISNANTSPQLAISDVESGTLAESGSSAMAPSTDPSAVGSSGVSATASIVDIATTATKVGWGKLTTWSREGLTKVMDVTGTSVATVSQSLWSRLNDTMLALVESDMKMQEEYREEQRKIQLEKRLASASASVSVSNDIEGSNTNDAIDAAIIDKMPPLVPSPRLVATASPRQPSNVAPHQPSGLHPKHTNTPSPRQPGHIISPRQLVDHHSPRLLLGSIPASNIIDINREQTITTIVDDNIVSAVGYDVNEQPSKSPGDAIDNSNHVPSTQDVNVDGINIDMVEVALDSNAIGNESVSVANVEISTTAPAPTQNGNKEKSGGGEKDKKKKKSTKKK